MKTGKKFGFSFYNMLGMNYLNIYLGEVAPTYTIEWISF